MKTKFIFIAMALLLNGTLFASTLSEQQTELYFEAIKHDHKKLSAFLYTLPKGGDLHNHESGATYAENMLRYAYGDNLCVNRTTYTIFVDAKCEPQNLLNEAIKDVSFKDALIDNWSMCHFEDRKKLGHDHFFATFGKFGLIVDMHGGEVLAEIMERAGEENEQYLELMTTADKNESGKLDSALGWDPDFNAMRNKLLSADFNKIMQDITIKLDDDESKMRSVLACDTNAAKVGCQVKVRYLYQVKREQPPEMVFAQLLAGFEAAMHDKRVVGLNMVQPEDGPISMRDYELHMQMIHFLHQYYPHVHVSLHAGELNSALVNAEGLSFHIHDAVAIAGADRIGHGVDIAQEKNADILLKKMAERRVMVEINLSSNAAILNIEGKKHPLPLYMRYGVPVALSTDDEGVSRSNLTKEYQRAVTTFQFNYLTIKRFIRNSIAYSFLPGKPLWKDAAYQQVVTNCDKDVLGSAKPSPHCKIYLNANEKANAQWELEKRFAEFENKHLYYINKMMQ